MNRISLITLKIDTRMARAQSAVENTIYEFRSTLPDRGDQPVTLRTTAIDLFRSTPVPYGRHGVEQNTFGVTFIQGSQSRFQPMKGWCCHKKYWREASRLQPSISLAGYRGLQGRERATAALIRFSGSAQQMI